MNAKLAAVGLSLGLLVFVASALAQSGAPPTAADVRREIAELKELLQAATLRLEALEQRLEHVGDDRGVQFQDWRNRPTQESYLRFPIDVERAMLVPIDYQRGGFTPGGVPPRDLRPLDLHLQVPLMDLPTLPKPDTLAEPDTMRPLDVPKLRP
jgi:hypothetical protein